MPIPLYLAMTAAEYRLCPSFPERTAWMACHFSPYGTGLCNLPDDLPEGSLLILNDRTPICGHDPDLICEQLQQTVTQRKCSGILADFQRPGIDASAELAARILRLPCPAAISDLYARDLKGPVFLSAPALGQHLKEYLSAWSGREIWLEAALGTRILTLTGSGCAEDPASDAEAPDCPHTSKSLHLRYRIDPEPEQTRITLRRTQEDLESFLQEAGELGVTQAVGLYQELKAVCSRK